MKEKIDSAIKQGELFFMGSKLPEDFYSGFIEWSQIAEKTQDPKAFYNMGYCLTNGEGTNKNIREAAINYRKALAGGIQEAADRLYECYGKHQLAYQIGLFSRHHSLKEFEEYKERAERFLSVINELIQLGYTKFERQKKYAQILFDVVSLSVDYVSDKNKFKANADRLAKSGYSWAKDFSLVTDCKIIITDHYEKAWDYFETIENGNTRMHQRNPHFVKTTTDEFFNSTNEDIQLYASSVKVRPNERYMLDAGIRSRQKVMSKDSEPETYPNGRWFAFMRMPEVNENLGFNSSVSLISLNLPVVRGESVNKENARTDNVWNIIGVIGIIVIALVAYMKFF